MRARPLLVPIALLACSSGSTAGVGDGSTADGDAGTGGSVGTDDGGDASDSGSGETSDDGTADHGGTTTGGAFDPDPGPDTIVDVFTGAHVYFLGGDNHRQIDAVATFPEAGLAYEAVTLELTLGCPNGLCDWWDRKGYIGIVEDAGSEDESVIEVGRFMTPYRVGSTHAIDVTHLRPLLAGDVTMRVFIDTWVGPGHANGDGWLVDASFDMKGGVPAELPIAVMPLWGKHEFVSGDPARPVIDQVPDVTVAIPGDATKVVVSSMITGHGQGNADNCAEFCQRAHGFHTGGQGFQRTIWRDDCQDTPVPGQQGTWMYPRAGWCPGAEVVFWIEDVTAAIDPGEDARVGYAMSDYENTCRPDSPSCTGCALGTGCDYDGGNHTEPHYMLSAVLVAYRATG